MKIQRQRDAFAYRLAAMIELSDEDAAAFEKYIKDNNGKMKVTLGEPEKVKGIPMDEIENLMAYQQQLEQYRNGPHKVWYHVSPNEMQDGTVLIPGGPDGNATSQDFYDMGFGDDSGTLADMGGGRNTHVWLTPDLSDAHFWAAALGAPHIYEVDPDDDPQPWNGTGTDGWVARGGKIRRRVSQ